MSLKMRIERCLIVTDPRTYDFAFQGPCTILDGPVGTGKSSLLELIKYCLGGGAVITPVVASEVRRVELEVRFGVQQFILSRPIGAQADAVTILDATRQEIVGVHPVRPRVNQETISDALLRLLGFPHVRIPRSRSRSTAASVPLSFNDVFSYVYVEQREIDRSVVHHRDTFREPKRRALFELMFGLTSQLQMELETKLGALKDQVKSLAARLASIEEFVSMARVEPRISLEQERARLTTDAAAAELSLDELRRNVRVQSETADRLSRLVRDAEAVAAATRMTQIERLAEVRRREQMHAQLNVDLQREDKAASASRRISPLEFVVCPRCMQDIDAHRTDTRHCTLCLQDVSGSSTMVATDDGLDALGGLVSQIEEAEKLLVQSRNDLNLINAEVVEQQLEADRLRAELSQETASSVSPRFDDIAFLSAQEARSVTARDAVDQSLAIWDEVDRLRTESENVERERLEAHDRLEEERQRLRARSDAIADLSDQFEETLRKVELPWVTSARVDANTYLPSVNNARFEDLAVAGGTLTMVTVAYHLTLLSYGMANSDTLLPSLLMLDTPRKNLGSNSDDKAMGDRLYRRIRAICDAYGADVQFIIADNDVPSTRDWYKTIHFDYDEPMLAHVQHPGEEAVRVGAVQLVGGNEDEE